VGIYQGLYRSTHDDHGDGEQCDEAEGSSAREHSLPLHRAGKDGREPQETEKADESYETQRGEEAAEGRGRHGDDRQVEPMRSKRGTLS
jgi:hypothetical protein